MSEKQRKYRTEDLDKVRELAKMLRQEYSPRKRMDYQQAFVKEMSRKYGHESATLLLTKAWKLAKRHEEDSEETYA